MEINVRKIENKDIDEILEIENNSFLTPWSRNSLEFEISSNALSKYILVENKDGILGYMGIWAIVDEGHVVTVAVDPKYRNKGLGRILMENSILLCKSLGLKSMTLEVRKFNEPAKKLYENLGFEPVGIRPKYYQDNGEDAIIMWKKFKDV